MAGLFDESAKFAGEGGVISSPGLVVPTPTNCGSVLHLFVVQLHAGFGGDS
jgi:hypothetical protein